MVWFVILHHCKELLKMFINERSSSNLGLSCRTVPAPTRIASWMDRKPCVIVRLSDPLRKTWEKKDKHVTEVSTSELMLAMHNYLLALARNLESQRAYKRAEIFRCRVKKKRQMLLIFLLVFAVLSTQNKRAHKGKANGLCGSSLLRDADTRRPAILDVSNATFQPYLLRTMRFGLSAVSFAVKANLLYKQP